MANATGLATKHGLATAAAIPTTLVVYFYLETLSPPGVALVFVLCLALFNGLAALLGQARGKQDDRS